MANIEPNEDLNDRMTDSQREAWYTLSRKGIREMKVIAREHGVKGFGSMTLAQLCDAVVTKRIEDLKEVENEVSEEERIAAGDLSPEEVERSRVRALSASEDAERESYRRIAKAADERERAEGELSKVRRECNEQVKEAKASFIGSMEMAVDYDDHASVRTKLDALTENYQAWDEAQAGRVEAMKPLKDALKEARKELREAVANNRQLGLKF